MNTEFNGLMRPTVDVLTKGDEFERCRDAALASGLVPEGYIYAKVADYPTLYKNWDHSLINFYYQNETDPRTTITALRVGVTGSVSRA